MARNLAVASANQTYLEELGVTPAMWATVKATVAPKDCPDEFVVLYFMRCKQVGADPSSKMLYIVNRKNRGEDGWRIESYVDFFRSAAVATGEYNGQEGPQWCGDDGVWLDEWLRDTPPTAARVKVFRKNVEHTPWITARYSAYYGSGANFLEKKLGEVLIAKVAEALAYRKAFPQQLSGVYVAEEMKQADDAKTVYPAGIQQGTNEAVPIPDDVARVESAVAATEKPDGKALRKAYEALQLLGETRSMGHYLSEHDGWMRPGAKPLKERSTAKVMLSQAETEAAYAIINADIAQRRPASLAAAEPVIEGEIIAPVDSDEVIYCNDCGAQTNPLAVAEPHEATCKNAPPPALPKPTEANIAALRKEMRALFGKDDEATAEWLYALLGAQSVDEIAEKGTDADCLLALKKARAQRAEDNIADS